MLQLVPPEGLTLFIERVFGKFHPHFPDAREFALRHRVLLVRSKTGIPIDISLDIPGYEEEALQRAVEVNSPGAGKLRLIGPEDLIIHKCAGGRPRDLEDVEGILIRQRLEIEPKLVSDWSESFQPLVDTHDPLELFEQAFHRGQSMLENGD